MKKYLLNNYGYEHNNFYGFESELSEDELNKQLEDVLKNTKNHNNLSFCGIVFMKNDMEGNRIMSLDNFWLKSLRGGC